MAYMITLARYSTIEDAQREASLLGKRGINVEIVYCGDGGIIPGTGTGVEIQVAPEELEKLSLIEDEFQEDLINDRRSKCPECGSKNYVNTNKWFDFFPEILKAFSSGISFFPASRLRFRCLDCDALFIE